MDETKRTCEEKALRINLDKAFYGTLAEIGAGQEVARYFFRVGGAAGTVAKSISAYDMKFSDAIYGPCRRYVSRERLETMLERELELLEDRLGAERGERTCFFVFADTVATRSYSRPVDGQGWLGVRFQDRPRAAPSDVLVHVRLLDKEAVAQQEALGILGVNLVHAALYDHESPERLIDALGDHLSPGRVDVNLIHLRGPAFRGVDHRLVNLELIRRGRTHAVMFDRRGEVVEPGEVVYKKPVVVQRGTFRPITRVHEDMLRVARTELARQGELDEAEIVPLVEITTANLRETCAFEPADYLSRLDTLAALERPVLISDLSEFYRLEAYLHRYTSRPIGFALGVRVLAEVLDEKYYAHLDGGLLEALGRLFKGGVRLLVYPFRDEATGRLWSAADVPLAAGLEHLRAHLLANGLVVPLDGYDPAVLSISSPAVLEDLRAGGAAWEEAVPAAVVDVVKRRGLFGYRADAAAPVGTGVI